MRRIAVMMTAAQPEALMSTHFAKAPWLMIAGQNAEALEFLRNDVLHGCAVVDTLSENGCTDVVLVDIGDGALQHLQSAQIRAWAAPTSVSGREALSMFGDGRLTPLPAARVGTRSDGPASRCCSHSEGFAAGCRHSL